MIKFVVTGANKLQKKLLGMAKESKALDNLAAVVGYTAGYALSVHENVEQLHANGQAKFLETPARQMRKEIARIVRTAKLKGMSTGQCLLLGGLKLQRESQLLVPVDTGNLKGSAFTALEKDKPS
jgi:hypothetical protein